MSVKSFLEAWPLPSGFILRRVVAVTAAVGATVGAPSMTMPLPNAHADTNLASTPSSSSSLPATALPGAPAAEFPAPVPASDPGLANGQVVPVGTSGPYGMDSAGQLTASGIPTLAYNAYVAAATTLATTDPTCQLNWSLIAGIARVESDHGRFNGSQIGPDGVVAPPILGVRLDGSTPGTATITDADGGRYDGDTQYDRAVGPMQFLPATWETYGSGGDPQNINTAALATGRYLCDGDTPLTTKKGRWAAVYRYNHSESYVSLVLSLASTYATGSNADFPTPPAGGTAPVTDAPPATTPGPPPALPAPRQNVDPPKRVKKIVRQKKPVPTPPSIRPNPVAAGVWPPKRDPARTPATTTVPTLVPTPAPTGIAPWPLPATASPTDVPFSAPSTSPAPETSETATPSPERSTAPTDSSTTPDPSPAAPTTTDPGKAPTTTDPGKAPITAAPAHRPPHRSHRASPWPIRGTEHSSLRIALGERRFHPG